MRVRRSGELPSDNHDKILPLSPLYWALMALFSGFLSSSFSNKPTMEPRACCSTSNLELSSLSSSLDWIGVSIQPLTPMRCRQAYSNLARERPTGPAPFLRRLKSRGLSGSVGRLPCSRLAGFERLDRPRFRCESNQLPDLARLLRSVNRRHRRRFQEQRRACFDWQCGRRLRPATRAAASAAMRSDW